MLKYKIPQIVTLIRENCLKPLFFAEAEKKKKL